MDDDQPMFPGVPVLLAGAKYVMPALSFGAFKLHKAAIRDLAEGRFTDAEQVMDAVTDVVHGALSRNYPGLQRSVVENAIDWHIGQDLFAQVMAQSIPPAPAGETPAASPSGASTGT